MPAVCRSILPLLIAFLVSASGPAGARPSLSVDVDTGTVISAHEKDRSWHPASVTKLMTAAVVLEAVRAGRMTLDTPIVFSQNAASVQPSKLGLQPGAALPLGDALRIMLTRSMNDIAVAIAETTAGSETNFARLMNLKAAALGMHGTRFVNASGLHDPRQVSTAADLAILARHLVVDLPQSASLFGIPSVTFAGKTLRNTNGLVGHYDGIRGMKTGYVCASGFNLVGLAERGSRRVITVVLGAPNPKTRERNTAALLDDAFASVPMGPILSSDVTMPTDAIDLKTKGCGKLLNENFSLGDTVSASPTPQDRPVRQWQIGGSLDDYTQ
ncbi:D-alanyl-D-alanine carboxypeptidase family protein [Rhizobium sp. BK176]|uniref:D-alanyl-D-alanine carboxypeptidase family protein n=1 Tax=Rhizobium sp. BK176 TaxID=2587071 RepID=UPI002167DAE4|nr:D-alanyl-D-alanine carboxypeptidase family protein [Rhizobium sp. BK176]MCS4088902.1 D-alanyl-D-alanine carboxypeptidase [Rhizobium sp. BK176]